MTEHYHNIPETLIWNYMVDLLMVWYFLALSLLSDFRLCSTPGEQKGTMQRFSGKLLLYSMLFDFVLQAVKHLHDYDLIHMDLKPENIFISEDDTCKLGDFGLVLDLSKVRMIKASKQVTWRLL